MKLRIYVVILRYTSTNQGHFVTGLQKKNNQRLLCFLKRMSTGMSLAIFLFNFVNEL